ncbi:glutaminyl-peptide cyclotransferase [Luteolibacter pohnpeiensis]|uniref:Glutaminyl-peptide cyclotransferase n=1 Tax=Luteolibacter pohnpeiensis TaxID=454153 RepID=A0A934SFQ0_9BACT|nr:glutaminyl-peptide cyclotransferase [Luteolibacter pohnpeiensis]MBK1884343.1 glutaminyl-peptide cyclotransferase [Luteolibacter pohnpeiensis]
MKTMIRNFLTLWVMPLVASFALFGCKSGGEVPVNLGYEVISVVPHDIGAYTQGLQIKDGRMFESTGQYGESTLRELEKETGKVLRKRSFPASIFGEGITLHQGELWMLTWQEEKGFVLDPETFKQIRQFHYKGEGWGLTSNGTDLIMSDGGSALDFVNGADFSVKKSVEVTNQGRSLRALNELEYVGGSVFANIYMTDRIARIDPESGAVTGWLDLSGLRSRLPQSNRAEVLNGVAYDEKTGHFWVTGKYWPQMFEIKLAEPK